MAPEVNTGVESVVESNEVSRKKSLVQSILNFLNYSFSADESNCYSFE